MKTMMIEAGPAVLRLYLMGISVEQSAEVFGLKKSVIRKLLNYELEQKCRKENALDIKQYWRQGVEQDLNLEIPVKELCAVMAFTGPPKAAILRYCKVGSIRTMSIHQLMELVYTGGDNKDYWRSEIHRFKGVGQYIYLNIMADMTTAPLGEDYQLEWGIRIRQFLPELDAHEQKRFKEYLKKLMR